ncbi:hypothetical protein ACFT7S_32230 [Streptomyces sp. NPDC057136]|uniref:hypothetical protein n=1 Tax=Streptomyces sp. NPDC057136 TaxID=3346029 RepID=UPI00362CA077
MAVALVGAASAVLAAPAAAAPLSNDPMCGPGTTRLVWTGVEKTWVVTHRSVPGAATEAGEVQKVDEVAALVKATAGAKISGAVVLAGLEESMGLELQAEGKVTNARPEAVSFDVPKDGTYVFYFGVEKVSGYYTQYRCDGGTKWLRTERYGKAQSWARDVEGGLLCSTKPPKASLAAVVKKKYC